MTHSELVQYAEKWLAGRTQFTFNDKLRTYTREHPDVIGFKLDYSVVVECKVSRADFFADQKKIHRNPRHSLKSMGNYRLYACPTDLIKQDELPTGWGLIYFNEQGKGKSIINPLSMDGRERHPYLFDADRDEEWRMMFSALRRLRGLNRLPEIYK